MATSNSYRRIRSDSADTLVLLPVVQRSDGHPDLHFPNGGWDGPDARLMLAAPEMAALLRRLIDIEGSQPGNVEWFKDVQAALAKAGL